MKQLNMVFKICLVGLFILAVGIAFGDVGKTGSCEPFPGTLPFVVFMWLLAPALLGYVIGKTENK